MIVHCTRKLGARLGKVSGGLPGESSPLGDWHANPYFIDRRQCVLFCHDESRYCLSLPGVRAQQLAEFGRWHRHLFLASLAVEGVEEAWLTGVELALGQERFDSATDRSMFVRDEAQMEVLNRAGPMAVLRGTAIALA